jgi:hypothetical protein
MIINNGNRTCEITGDMPVEGFAIAASAKMFSILSDKLYTKKELAIVRELICNAWDAHVAAGTTATPIEIHMPNALEPYFSITDYGTGLSPENISRLYTTYGASSKTGTNDQIGGFGLGSKSPFAYTDQFSIISRINGRTYNFQAFIGQNGAPGCAKVSEEETPDAPNGMTVTVPVANNALSNWVSALRTLYQYIPVKPTITGLDPALRTFVDAGTDSYIHKLDVTDIPHVIACAFNSKKAVFDDNRGHNSVVIVQGMTPYRVFAHGIKSNDENIQRVMSSGVNVVLWVDIGTFTVTASREAIEETKGNNERLSEILIPCIEKLLNESFKTLPNTKTWGDLARAHYRFPIYINKFNQTVLDQITDPAQKQTLEDAIKAYNAISLESPILELFKLCPAHEIKLLNHDRKIIKFYKPHTADYEALLKAHIHVRKKRSQYIAPYWDSVPTKDPSRRHFLFTGEIDTLKQALAAADIVNEVTLHEIPEYQRPPRQKSSSIRGNFSYPVFRTHDHHAVFQDLARAQDLVDLMISDPKNNLLLIHDSLKIDMTEYDIAPEHTHRTMFLAHKRYQSKTIHIAVITRAHTKIPGRILSKCPPGTAFMLSDFINNYTNKYRVRTILSAMDAANSTTPPFLGIGNDELLRTVQKNTNNETLSELIRLSNKFYRLREKTMTYAVMLPQNLRTWALRTNTTNHLIPKLTERLTKRIESTLEDLEKTAPHLHRYLESYRNAPQLRRYDQTTYIQRLATDLAIKEINNARNSDREHPDSMDGRPSAIAA